MAKGSDNLFPYVHLTPAAAPASPAAGAERLYLDSGDGNRLKRKSSSGTVTPVEGTANCAVYRNAALSASSGVVTVIDFDAEDTDTNSFHDLVTNPSRVTIPAGMGGTYSIAGQIGFTSAGTGGDERTALIYKNGASVSGTSYPAIGSLNAPVCFPIGELVLPLAAGDYIDLRFYHNTGAAVAMLVGSARRYTRLSVTRIA